MNFSLSKLLRFLNSFSSNVESFSSELFLLRIIKFSNSLLNEITGSLLISVK